MANNSKIILGIDPGTLVMGYGIIEIKAQQPNIIVMGVLKLSKHKDHYHRLQQIHHRVHELILQYNPHACAIEAPFFGKNVQSMLKLGRAQGVAIATAMQQGVDVTEYSPKKVKQSITGNGNANKEQVWQMLQHILKFDERPEYLDATDALAVAVCHHFQDKLPVPDPGPKTIKKGKKSSWQQFMNENPGRVVR
ncbi:crossover junction endodeoxyribonuclease RuvC [Chitinophaga caeni]|uniref:Crossover junction endodeoxyribonuclease RuvC n=1 Tax=Chitinophaga caeni TaxID=2029983 RepID=A0A291QT98_9BACT|nr:crossover junction endodeoxyribonuclease RuvC [Chitinophaga caeni]ATL47093.1 crossover junction endodeoxyribonuclease RuvC [Chitinophaga caeni]